MLEIKYNTSFTDVVMTVHIDKGGEEENEQMHNNDKMSPFL